jgi:hypothetical protein
MPRFLLVLALFALVRPLMATTNGLPPSVPNYITSTAEVAVGARPVQLGYPPGNVLRYGADPTGSADSTLSIQAALNFAISINGTVVIPQGSYQLTSQIVATMPTATSSVSIIGSGAEGARLVWAAGQGMQINYIGAFNSAHVRDLSFLTGVAGTRTQRGLVLNQTADNISNPALTALSDVTNCVFRGSDGYGLTFYWQSGLYIQSVSNINITNDYFSGANIPSTAGIGITLTGASTTAIGVVYNVLGSTFTDLALGIDYLSNVQGVTVSQSNFTGTLTAIQVPSPATNDNQLTVTGNQISAPGVGVLVQTYLPNIQISTNLFFVGTTARNSGIELANAGLYTIIGNIFGAPSPTFISSARGVSIDSTNCTFPAGVVASNVFQAMGVGVNLASGSSNVTVQANAFTGGVLNVKNEGSNNFVINDPGYNNSFQPVTIVKPTDQAITSNTTMTNDTALSVALVAPATYTLDCLLFSDATITADMGEKIGFFYTGTYASSAISGRATINGVQILINANPATVSPLFSNSSISTTNPSDSIQFYGFVITATPGNFGLQWSQNTSSASALTMRRGSRCTITRTG